VTVELYRFFNQADELLYVGITENWPARFHEHAKKASWYKQAKRIELESFDTREEALAAELKAIHEECPVWNVNGNASASAVTHFLEVVKWAEDEKWHTPFHEVIVQELGEALDQLDLGLWEFPEKWQTHPKMYAPIFSDFVQAMAPFGLIPCEVCLRAATHGTVTKWREEVIDFIDTYDYEDEDLQAEMKL
jgi:hypothetical protein